jgi:hypothetical protein
VSHNDALAALATAAGWRKSRHSQAQNTCVEVTTELPGWVGVRDSKLGTASPLLAIRTAHWQALLATART